MFFIREKKSKAVLWLLLGVVIFFMLSLFSITGYLLFEKKYENRFYPGVIVANTDLGGMSLDEALMLFDSKINEIMKKGLAVEYKENNQAKKSFFIMPTISSMGIENSYQIIYFNPRDTLNEALRYGRSHSIKDDIFNKLKLIGAKKDITFQYRLNEDEALKILQENFQEFSTSTQNASLQAKLTNNQFEFELIKEKDGKVIDYQTAIEDLNKRLANLDQSPILLLTRTESPSIKISDALNINQKAKELAKISPIKLQYEKNIWILKDEDFFQLFALSRSSGNEVIVDLDIKKIENYLQTKIAEKLFIEPKAARFEVSSSKVTKFQLGKNGQELNIAKSAIDIRNAVINEAKTEIALSINIIENDISEETVNNSGIKELIGSGHSSYAGSPTNRRHNIKTGALSLNGLLIKPNEEFSLVKALGAIDQKTGYLPELVIKDNKTIPEFGGGLCQVGTTLFRAVLNTGLPITQRRNHSYRVSYYEPAGTDATIYSPWPDFRFFNDTDNYILIQARLEGNSDIYFDIWGTKDGRVATSTYPYIYNIKKPAPTRIIETNTLKPGEKKCTERAHNGADAWFDYSISYAKTPNASSTEVIRKNFDTVSEENFKISNAKKRFYSHYVPWQEVCLVGAGKKNASSSPEIKENTPSEKEEPSENTDLPPTINEKELLSTTTEIN